MPDHALVSCPSTDLTSGSTTQNPAVVYLASLGSANSRRAMRRALTMIAELVNWNDPLTFPWQNLRYEHTAAIRAALSERYKFTTANHALSALRGALKTAADLGLMSADACRAACNLKPVRGQSLPSGRDLAPGEILALVHACKADKTAAGVRDTAIIGVLYTCGLRRAELAALALADYEPSTGKLPIHSGKGNKDRTVYAANGAKAALDTWLMMRGAEAGPLFYAINKGGRMTGKGMTAQAVYLILQKRATQAGVKPFSPHDFRRTFVGDMLDHGADIVTVQKLAGHASPTTTSRYDRRDEETKKKAAGLLHFPF